MFTLEYAHMLVSMYTYVGGCMTQFLRKKKKLCEKKVVYMLSNKSFYLKKKREKKGEEACTDHDS